MLPIKYHALKLLVVLAMLVLAPQSQAPGLLPPQPAFAATEIKDGEPHDKMAAGSHLGLDAIDPLSEGVLFPGLFDDVWTPSAATMGADGSLHFVAHIFENGMSEVYYVRSLDGTVLEKQNLSDNPSTSLWPDLLVDGDVIRVAWQDNQSGTDQIYYRSYHKGQWSSPQQVSPSTGGAYAPKLTAMPEGQIQVEWTEYSGQDTHIYRCKWTGAECASLSMSEHAPGESGNPLNASAEEAGLIAFLQNGEIWTVREMDLVFRRVTNTGGRVFAFAWSPDGQQLAYTGLTNELEQLCDIYIINKDGTGQQRLTTSVRASRWVIDWHANKIAFFRLMGTNPYERISYVTTGGSLVDVAGDIPNYGIGFNLFSAPRMRWSQDGQWIALSHGTANAVVSMNGSKQLISNWFQPDWNPDSSHLVYDYNHSEIRKYYPNSGNSTQLSTVDAYFPTYSPDANTIAYGSPYLRRMNSDNTGHLTIVYDRAVEMDWSYAGEKITYVNWYDNGTPYPGIYGIYVIGVNGNGRRQLVNGYAGSPAWQPIVTYSISGRITNPAGSPIAGVLVSGGAGHSAVSDSNGNYTLAYLTTGIYTIRPSKAGNVFCPVTRRVDVSGNVANENFTGFGANLVLGFCPKPNGYSFSNDDDAWGSFPENVHDFGYPELRRMFGQDNVCIMNGSICTIKPQASEWHDNANKLMNDGHCDGMAVTSLRFFKGLDLPSEFNPNASTTYELGMGDTRRHIAYYFVKQLADPVLAYKSQTRQNAPSAILNQLRSAMQGGGTDPTVLFVWQAGEGGHAITPFAIEDRGNDVSWVRVYDNNHPDDLNRYVVINTTAQTWTYNFGSTTWSGNATTQTLGFAPISKYAEPPVCPWCGGSTGLSESNNPMMQEIWLSGPGHLLVTDVQGRHLGYTGTQFRSEIPGAYGGFIDGGLGIEIEPIYKLPVSDSYTILLDGQTVNQSEDVSVTQFGPGYAVQVDNVLLQSSVRDNITIAADGSQITYQPNQSRAPSLSLVVDDTSASHELKVSNAEVSANQQVVVAAQGTTGRLVYSNAQASGGGYDLFVRRVSASGVQLFAHNDLTIAGGDTHYADYRNWNGRDSMTLLVDHASNGTIDETVTMENQIRSMYLPIVLGK